VLALVSGSLWGRPVGKDGLGTRAEVGVILLFLYVGVMSMRRPRGCGARGPAAALLAIGGVVNVHIIHTQCMVNSLHQGARC